MPEEFMLRMLGHSLIILCDLYRGLCHSPDILSIVLELVLREDKGARRGRARRQGRVVWRREGEADSANGGVLIKPGRVGRQC